MLEPCRERLEASRRPAIQVNLQPAERMTPWQSKLLGDPYWPRSIPYPMAYKGLASGYGLVLLLQLNFAEMPRLPFFPDQGILQIFLDATEYDIGSEFANTKDDPEIVQAVYHEIVIQDRNHIMNDFSGVIDEYSTRELEEYLYYPCQLSFYRGNWPVHYNHPIHEEIIEDITKYFDFSKSSISRYNIENSCRSIAPFGITRISGYPDIYQSIHEDFPLDRFTLLFQIASNEDSGVNINGGYIYIFIETEKLEKKDFSKIYIANAFD